MSTTTRSRAALPFQPSSMSPAQLAAGLLGEHDDARRSGLLPVRAHRRHHPSRPGRVRRAPEGPPRRVPHPRLGPAGADLLPPGRPDHHRPPRRIGRPARDQPPARFRGGSGAHRGLHGRAAGPPGAAPCRQGQQACRGERTAGPLVLRPLSGKPIDRRDVYRMVQRIAKAAQIPRHISPHSLRHAAITNALDAGVPLRDAQILARHADPRTTEHYDRARGNLDRHGVHFLTAYVAGV